MKPERMCSITSIASTMPNAGTRRLDIGALWSSNGKLG
jgi:hypothetical protein